MSFFSVRRLYSTMSINLVFVCCCLVGNFSVESCLTVSCCKFRFDFVPLVCHPICLCLFNSFRGFFSCRIDTRCHQSPMVSSFPGLVSTSDAVSMRAPVMFSRMLSQFSSNKKLSAAHVPPTVAPTGLLLTGLSAFQGGAWAFGRNPARFLQFQRHYHHSQVVTAVDRRFRKYAVVCSTDTRL